MNPASVLCRDPKRAPGPGEQGPELLQVLEVVLAAPAMVALVGCLRAYIEARRPTMRVVLTTATGTVAIEARNPPPTAELERMATALMPPSLPDPAAASVP